MVSNHFEEGDETAETYNIKHVMNLRHEADEHDYTVTIKRKTDKTEFREHTRVFLFVPQNKGAVSMSRNHDRLTTYAQSFSEEMTALVKQSGTAYTPSNGKLITNRFTYMVHKNLPEDNLNNPITLGDLLTVQDTGEVMMGVLNASRLAELSLPHNRSTLHLFFGLRDEKKVGVDRVSDYFVKTRGDKSGGDSGYASGFMPSTLQSGENEKKKKEEISKLWDA